MKRIHFEFFLFRSVIDLFSQFQRSFRNIFSNYTSAVNLKYNSFNFTIQEDPSRFSFSLHMFKAVESVFCTLSFDLTTSHGRSYQNFFLKTYDYCSFMEKPTNEFFMLLVHGELSKAGLWMRKCPLQTVNTLTKNARLIDIYSKLTFLVFY